MTEARATVGDAIDSWEDLWALRDRSVHVVGAGSVEGAHLLLFLLDHGFTRLVGHDFSDPAGFERAFKRVHVGWPMEERNAMLERILAGVELRYRDRYLEGVDGADAIAVTQAWYLYENNRPLAESPELQARFFSLVQLYLALAPGRVVGVTGSQGKSTTTRLIGDMLTGAGFEVIRAGNDRHGQQALGALETASDASVLVLEISNRHLKMLRRSPDVAVVTNVYPNHLEEHGGWDGYVEAKSRIVAHQRAGNIAVLNADLEVTRGMASLTPAQIAWFGTDDVSPGIRVTDGEIQAGAMGVDFSLPRKEILVPGEHNAMNIAAACTAALAMKVPPAAITAAVRGFRGLKHRIQFIWEANGVRYYDDLNSTTPTASMAALRTIGSNVIWILGGDDKGLDSEELARVARDTVRTAIALPGPGTEAITSNLEKEGVLVMAAESLQQAVSSAAEIGKSGDCVVLSPACPGFFTRYYVGADEDTGFKKLVREATLPTSPLPRKPRRSTGPG